VDRIVRSLDTDYALFDLKQVGDFSEFQPCTLNDVIDSKYRKHWTVLDKYLNYGSGSEMDVVKSIRPILEQTLYHRFPSSFGAHLTLGQMVGEIGRVDAMHELHLLKVRLEELKEINQYCIDNAHGDDALVLEEAIAPDQLKRHIRWTINFVRGSN